MPAQNYDIPYLLMEIKALEEMDRVCPFQLILNC